MSPHQPLTEPCLSLAAHTLVCFSCSDASSNWGCLKPVTCGENENYCVTTYVGVGLGESSSLLSGITWENARKLSFFWLEKGESSVWQLCRTTLKAFCERHAAKPSHIKAHVSALMPGVRGELRGGERRLLVKGARSRVLQASYAGKVQGYSSSFCSVLACVVCLWVLPVIFCPL